MEYFVEHLSSLTRFAIVIGLSVLLPKLMERFRLPAVLGFIATGVVVGPHVLNIIKPDGPVITLFAEIGKLLFMFFVGFEIDLEQFNKSRRHSLLFGLLTFLLPFCAAAWLGLVTGSGWNSSLLIGSLAASHTLLAFPVLQRLNLVQHPAVLMVLGGTVFTDIAAMLVLAITVSVHVTGFSWQFLVQELLQLAVFVPLVLFGAGSLARKAIIRYGERPEFRVMILLVVIIVCSEGAQLIQLEGIVGAFLAGVAVKRAVRGKFAVEQLEITAQAMFIPVFFITTGFLVNFQLLGKTASEHPALVLGLIAALLIGKYVSAWIAIHALHGTRAQTGLAWSLSVPQMAATLASAVVAYNTVNANGVRLLGEMYINAVLVMVVATCILGPILTERYAKRVLQEQEAVTVDTKSEFH